MSDGVYVGLAQVLSRESDGRPRVTILGGTCETTIADWAIPYRYEAQPKDLLQVLGQDGRYWVTGIAQGKGLSHVAFQGHTKWHADGTMHLSGDGGIRFDSPEVRIETDTLESEANHIVQRIDSFDSCIPGTHNERAGTSERIIDEDDEQTAAKHKVVAAHAAKLNAELIRLS